jgi:hypothetical protein
MTPELTALTSCGLTPPTLSHSTAAPEAPPLPLCGEGLGVGGRPTLGGRP